MMLDVCKLYPLGFKSHMKCSDTPSNLKFFSVAVLLQSGAVTQEKLSSFAYYENHPSYAYMHFSGSYVAAGYRLHHLNWIHRAIETWDVKRFREDNTQDFNETSLCIARREYIESLLSDSIDVEAPAHIHRVTLSIDDIASLALLGEKDDRCFYANA